MMEFLSICTGFIVSLDSVPDEVFRNRILGDGFAFLLENNRIVAPVTGTIKYLFPKGHAFVILTEAGVEVLIHFGVGTFNAPSSVLTLNVQEGQKVRAGELMVSIDLNYFKSHHINTITSVVLMSGEKIAKFKNGLKVHEGEDIDRVVFG